MSVRALDSQIKNGQFARIYLFYGAEGYLATHYARSVSKSAVPSMQTFNLHQFSADTFDLSKLTAAVEHLPMMAARSCVVLWDIDPDTLKAKDWKDYLALLSDAPDSCVLVLAFAHVPYDKKSAHWKALIALAQKAGVAEQFSPPTKRELEKWVMKRARAAGASMSAEAADALAEACGADMNRMAAEVEKLAAYMAGNEIGKDTVDALVYKDVASTIYDLARAVISGRLPIALGILGDLFDQKEEPVIILSALSQAFCDLYRAAVACAAGKGQTELAADFPYRGREFRIRNALRDCRGLSIGFLREALERLLAADKALKSSGADSRLVLERLCVDLSQLRKQVNAG